MLRQREESAEGFSIGTLISGKVLFGVTSRHSGYKTTLPSIFDGMIAKKTSRTMKGSGNHQKSINVWDCFSWSGVGDLHRVKVVMTGPVHYLVSSARRLCGNNLALITIQNTQVEWFSGISQIRK